MKKYGQNYKISNPLKLEILIVNTTYMFLRLLRHFNNRNYNVILIICHFKNLSYYFSFFKKSQCVDEGGR